MHARKKCHHHIWLLSGTEDGKPLAKALISLGWDVSVSVTSLQGSKPYLDLPLRSLWIGQLDGVKGIQSVLQKARDSNNPFNWVVDATHPFALQISLNLQIACKDFDQKLIRYERFCENLEGANFIKNLKDIGNVNLKGKRLLLAIGARHLKEGAFFARKSGATIFARVMPSSESVVKSLASKVPDNRLAVIHPSHNQTNGELEKALCRKWLITSILCRQSGGSTQKVWQSICKQNNLDLWLISRPCLSKRVETFHNNADLLKRIAF